MTVSALREKIIAHVNQITNLKHLQIILGLAKAFSQKNGAED